LLGETGYSGLTPFTIRAGLYPRLLNLKSGDGAMGETTSRAVAEWLAATREQLRRKVVHDLDFSAFGRYGYFRNHARVVMDIGANRGQSIASLLAMLPDVRIHAFEANPTFHDVLQEIADECGGQVDVHRFGLGKVNAWLDFYLPSGGGVPFLEEASTRLDYFELPWVKQKFDERGGLSLEVIRVEVRQGDNCGLRPDIVKIDVEGAEADVLAGLHETIRGSVPVLLVENGDWHGVTSFLAARGYEAYRFLQDERALVPFFGETTNTFYIHESAVAAVLAS
jgi:FkbM family methyltransferase